MAALALGVFILLVVFLAGVAVGIVARYEVEGRPDLFT